MHLFMNHNLRIFIWKIIIELTISIVNGITINCVTFFSNLHAIIFAVALSKRFSYVTKDIYNEARGELCCSVPRHALVLRGVVSRAGGHVSSSCI